jgi:transcriptional repressor NrdR
LEEIEILALRVVKADGREESYDKEKLVRSVRLPTQKRPISPARFKRLISMIEQDIQTRARADRMTTQQIGEIVMKHLKRLDKIAYIRFAAVYQSFDDLTAFAEALEQLKPRRKTGVKRTEKKKK